MRRRPPTGWELRVQRRLVQLRDGTRFVVNYWWPGNPELEVCVDCDRPELDCRCEGRARCSCGHPILSCPCAYGSA